MVWNFFCLVHTCSVNRTRERLARGRSCNEENPPYPNSSMKKAVVALTMLAAAICGARAGIILSDNFTYSNGTVSNGVLTTISGGTWYAHSAGGSVPIQVINGRADRKSTRLNSSHVA